MNVIFGDVPFALLTPADRSHADLERWSGVSPDLPELTGRNVLDVNYGDPQPPARAMLERLKTADRGWFEYHWPKPGASAPVRKTSYARRVVFQGQTYVLAAGMFVE